jgi:hypothetical protein
MKRKRTNKKIAPSSFFTMKENKSGASVGNFVNNIKTLPAAFKTVGKSIAEGVRVSGGRKVRMNKRIK